MPFWPIYKFVKVWTHARYTWETKLLKREFWHPDTFSLNSIALVSRPYIQDDKLELCVAVSTCAIQVRRGHFNLKKGQHRRIDEAWNSNSRRSCFYVRVPQPTCINRYRDGMQLVLIHLRLAAYIEIFVFTYRANLPKQCLAGNLADFNQYFCSKS